MEGSGEGSLASLVGDAAAWFISGRSEASSGWMDSRTIAVGSSASANRGSVTLGALCRGVEDRRCSLLACMTPSLPGGAVDEDATE